MNAFGRALQDELKAKNINQTDLANRLGITSSAVSGWVTGARLPSRSNAERIEDELDIKPRGRLRRLLVAPESPVEMPLEHYISSDNTIPEEDRYALLRVVRNIRVATGEPVAETPENNGELRDALRADRERRLSELTGDEEDPPESQRPSRPA